MVAFNDAFAGLDEIVDFRDAATQMRHPLNGSFDLLNLFQLGFPVTEKERDFSF